MLGGQIGPGKHRGRRKGQETNFHTVSDLYCMRARPIRDFESKNPEYPDSQPAVTRVDYMGYV